VYVRSTVADEHVFAGAESHVTPAHGSGKHAPALQPSSHGLSVNG
jgi:hypothetical protein